MKLTPTRSRSGLGRKNDISLYPDTALNKVEFDSRFVTTGDLFVSPQRERVTVMTLFLWLFENGCAVNPV